MFVARHIGQQHFDGIFAAQGEVSAEVHRTHGALTQQRLDLILAGEDRPDEWIW